MESKKVEAVRELELLQHLTHLRKMIVHHHDLENISDFVLHDLCSGPCFDVNKAAYFINNPDFRMLRGITGYNKEEEHVRLHDRWNNQKEFIASIKNSNFNNLVRSKSHDHFEKSTPSQEYAVQKLADDLEIKNPAYHVWNLKHANQGLLIYEAKDDDAHHAQSHVRDALYYLSFCPVY